MKKLSVIMLAVAMIFGLSEFATAAPKKGKATKAKEQVVVGKIVPMADFLRGEVASTKDKVNKAVEEGQPIVVVSGKGKAAKAYFVIGTSGGYAAKHLAKYAGYDEISVYGQKYTTGGINYIIFSDIVGK